MRPTKKRLLSPQPPEILLDTSLGVFSVVTRKKPDHNNAMFIETSTVSAAFQLLQSLQHGSFSSDRLLLSTLNQSDVALGRHLNTDLMLITIATEEAFRYLGQPWLVVETSPAGNKSDENNNKKQQSHLLLPSLSDMAALSVAISFKL